MIRDTGILLRFLLSFVAVFRTTYTYFYISCVNTSLGLSCVSNPDRHCTYYLWQYESPRPDSKPQAAIKMMPP